MVDETETKLDEIINSTKAIKKAAKAPVKISDDSGELTEQEKLELQAEAAAEVSKELKNEKRKAFKAAEKQKLKRQVLFRHGKNEEGEGIESVLVTLAPHTPYIALDGERFYPNRVYHLGAKRAAVLKEQMFRGDLHDNETHGKKTSEFYGQRPQGLSIGPNTPLPTGLN